MSGGGGLTDRARRMLERLPSIGLSMKRGAGERDAGSELAAVLDSVDDGVGLMSEAELERLAAAEEERRAHFDAVLTRPWESWKREDDPRVLREALGRVLREIKGTSVDPAAPRRRTKRVVREELDEDEKEEKASERKGRAGDRDQDRDVDMIGSNGTENGMVHGVHNGLKNGARRGVRNSMRNGVENSIGNSVENGLQNGMENGRVHNERKGKGGEFVERAKYIPMRLTREERMVLRLVEAALVVSEYTDQVDVLTYSRAKTKHRIHAQIKNICSILTGLMVASDYAGGQKLIRDRDFAENEVFFKTAFEIGRRHKVANPEKMRTTYGKLMHMLQDSANGEIVRLLDFTCVKPLVTVSSFLQERNGSKLLEDELVEDATREVKSAGKGRSRYAVQRDIKQKERAVEVLARRYRNGSTLTEDDIRRCLYSIGDNNAYLRAARDPCEIMIDYLKTYFGRENCQKDRSSTLAIVIGRGGARLTHDHKRQYVYVHQSLTLWREVTHEMYKLWYMAESDLLSSTNPYVLRNTGQGLHRVQPAPNVSRAMRAIIRRVQTKVGSWIGSSVIHLGDHNVPNALMFLDKYAQVPRILLPITTCIRRLGEIVYEDKSVAKYVEDNWGGVENARKIILRDFFRHAFDGSGADNFFDAGSCVDGRLTSAWNWCSTLEKKPYYPLFLLTGFVGFDGEW